VFILFLLPRKVFLLMCGGAVIPALGRLRQEDCRFETNLGYIVVFKLAKHVLKNQVLYDLSHNSNPFCCGYFRNRVSQTTCPGGP
jgi:hypothetical protein